MAKRKPKAKKDPNAIVPIPCSSFAELVSEYEDVLEMSQPLEDSLAVILATLISTPLVTKNPIWIRLIGPPGSAKTTIAESVSALKEFVFPISKLTGLHSGYVEPGASREEDNSIIIKMVGKMTVIKDADTIFSSSSCQQVMSELRDFFDGDTRADYRNKVSRTYENIKGTVVLCGTDEMRKVRDSSLGARFMDCEIVDHEDEGDAAAEKALRMAISSFGADIRAQQEDNEETPKDFKYLKQVTAGFILGLKEYIEHHTLPTIPDKAHRRLTAMAKLLSIARARIAKGTENILVRPRAEFHTRLTQQFSNLALSSALVLHRPKVDGEVLRLVFKIMEDTAHGYEYEIIKSLYYRPGIRLDDLTETLPISDTTVANKLEGMSRFGIVDYDLISNGSGKRGRKVRLWRLSSKGRRIYKEAVL